MTNNEVTVFYRDDQIIVAYKPYGALSEQDDNKPNMLDLLKAETGCETVIPVHRLDRTTQGLMVYAKTKEAASRLSAQIQRGEVEKTYLAVVQGEPVEPEGELCDLLYFDRRKNKSYVVRRERKGVKQARLTYEMLNTTEVDGEKISLLKIRLLTGRTHQIRVQFASRKLPLVGERRYGGRLACENIQLCSSQLSFAHPFTDEKMDFSFTPTNEYFGCFVGEGLVPQPETAPL